jgi:hypothetical protein
MFMQQGNLLHFKTCCMISVLFPIKCRLFHNFIFFRSNNVFFTTMCYNLNTRPGRVKDNVVNTTYRLRVGRRRNRGSTSGRENRASAL